MMHGTSAVPLGVAPRTEQPGSPFDGIRREDEQGEWWSARELMPLLGYSRWESFDDAVSRASVSAANAGVDGDHFRGVPRVIEGGRWGTQTVQDYRLTRYGAYLVAMNGDPRKPEIAAAQTYFAVRTREAEVRPALPQDLPTALRAWADEVEARQRAELERQEAWAEATRVRAIAAGQEEQIRRDAPKVGYVEHFVDPPKDSCTVRVLAKELGCGEQWLYLYLKSHKRIYKDPNGMYQPYAPWKKWFALRDQHEAPRLHNGQVRTTLYVLPPGKEGIRRMLDRDPELG